MTRTTTRPLFERRNSNPPRLIGFEVLALLEDGSAGDPTGTLLTEHGDISTPDRYAGDRKGLPGRWVANKAHGRRRQAADRKDRTVKVKTR